MAKEDYTVQNMEGLLVGELGMTLAGDLNELEDRERIDLKTPGYKSKMEKELSKQQRKILISMAREGKPLRVREVAVVSRMFQQNACSSQLGRMITKGFLGRTEEGKYEISGKDSDFKLYLNLRHGGRLVV